MVKNTGNTHYFHLNVLPGRGDKLRGVSRRLLRSEVEKVVSNELDFRTNVHFLQGLGRGVSARHLRGAGHLLRHIPTDHSSSKYGLISGGSSALFARYS
jgi:hypothetical protein